MIHAIDRDADEELFLTEVAEAVSRGSRTAAHHGYIRFAELSRTFSSRTLSRDLRCASQMWICISRRLVGVAPPGRRRKMAFRKKYDVIRFGIAS